MVGRTAAHTHVSTQNNLYLSELVPENLLWINDQAADRLGIKDGEYVEVASPLKTTGKIKAKVTELIHPEAVFMLHGFGKTVPCPDPLLRQRRERRPAPGKRLRPGGRQPGL